jgi:hypothetical protein
MREVTIKIPEEKFEFYMELFGHLDLETEFEHEIPEEHKEIVRERIKNSKSEDLIPWEEARKMMKFKK